MSRLGQFERGNESRFSVKVPTQLPVSLVGADTKHEMCAVDVSKYGIFVRTDTPVPPGERLNLRVRLLPGLEFLTLTGLVVRSADDETPRKTRTTRGMAVNLNSLGGRTRQRWHEYVNNLEWEFSRGHRPQHAYTSVPEKALRHRRPGQDSTVEIKVTDPEPLLSALADDVVLDGVFVFCKKNLPLRQRVALEIRHPETGEYHSFVGRVCRIVEKPPSRGMGIEFSHRNGCGRKARLYIPSISLSEKQITIETARPSSSSPECLVRRRC